MGGRGDESFHIGMPKLPAWIEERALASGGYPYDNKLPRKRYEKELRALQIELVKLLNWTRSGGGRMALVFEGRDSAGKGGAIQRLTAHLNPRFARVVALPRPTSTQATQWYFQRYAEQLPAGGEIAIFDRSWYNRAGVEPVFGFCDRDQTERFLRDAPEFEAMLVRDGVRLVKFFLTIGKEEQMRRLYRRWKDPLHRWKISEIDEKAVERWSDYSAAFDRMLRKTDHQAAPWTIVRANDKRRARLEIIRHLLDLAPYKHKDASVVGEPDRRIAMSAAAFLKAGGEEP